VSFTSVFRQVTYRTRQDADGELTWAAACVSGEVADCGESSGELGSEETANEWMAEHTARTGHKRFKRGFSDYAVVEPLS
jgi:hypothetical protein